MKRSQFLKGMGALGVAMAAGGLATSCVAAPSRLGGGGKTDWSNKKSKWTYLGSRDVSTINKDQHLKFDVVVLGGGMAGISAAVAAARRGSKTCLVQNRSVLGGNASSEVHVPINGSYHLRNKFKIDRETGIVEEIMLENKYYNPQHSWEVWDHVMYDYVTREPNLTLFLDTMAVEAVMSGNKIKSAICFQQCCETRLTIDGEVFIDCSGDGMLAVSAGAEYRSGREGKAEFGEKYAPDEPDGWVMGDSIQFNTMDLGRPVKFIPPTFAIKYDPSKMNRRVINQLECGFWWVEIGDDLDITTNTENARHLLLAYLYGAWDYVKNSGKFPEAENLAMNWVGSVPGRRESRRFMGDYIVTEKDLTEYRHFDDTVAFAGGWSLDEHCPGAILNPTDPASFFHQGFTKHTEIPYRALYSKNIDNLMFAGRNYSCSHIALSGTRLIAMCAQMGQAAGTAATICVNKGCTPRGVYQIYMNELQEMIMRDDAYIPNRPAADPADLARKAKIVASSTASGDVKLLVDGISRDEVDKPHHWRSKGVDSNLVLSWDAPQTITSVEIKCDTDLQTEIQLHPNKAKMALRERGMPEEMVKAVALDVKVGGGWKEVASIDDNLHRLIKLPVESIKSDAVRIRFKESYGVENLRIFEVRCY